MKERETESEGVTGMWSYPEFRLYCAGFCLVLGSTFTVRPRDSPIHSLPTGFFYKGIRILGAAVGDKLRDCAAQLACT